MSRLQQKCDMTASNSFTKPHGWSFPLREDKMAPAAVASKISEDANHPNQDTKQDAAEEVSSDKQEDGRVSRMKSDHRNLHGLSFQTELRTKNFASSLRQDQNIIRDSRSSSGSSDSTWLPTITIEHSNRDVGNNYQAEEAVDQSHVLEHAKKLGSLLVSVPRACLLISMNFQQGSSCLGSSIYAIVNLYA